METINITNENREEQEEGEYLDIIVTEVVKKEIINWIKKQETVRSITK